MIRLFTALLLSFQATPPPAVVRAPVLPTEQKRDFRAHSAPACPDWRAARAGKVKDSDLFSGVHRMWVRGYVTGFNIAGPDQTGNLLGSSPDKDLYAAIDDFCVRHPSRSVVDGMRPIATAIIGRRVPALVIPPPTAAKSATVMITTTCRDWTQNRSNAILRLAYVAALHGYITAYNEWGPDVRGDAIGADDRSVTEMVADRWCNEHPPAFLIGAITPLIDHVAAERGAGRLPPGGKRANDETSQKSALKR